MLSPPPPEGPGTWQVRPVCKVPEGSVGTRAPAFVFMSFYNLTGANKTVHTDSALFFKEGSYEETPEVEWIRGASRRRRTQAIHLVGASCRGGPAWGGGMATGKGAGGSEAWRGPGWPGWLVES